MANKPSILWQIVEWLTKTWARYFSVLSIPGFTTAKGRPAYKDESVCYKSRRDAYYILNLFVGFAICICLSLPFTSQLSDWVFILLLSIGIYQIVDIIVLMLRISIFGSHDKVLATQWSAVPVTDRQRFMLVFVLCYLITINWFSISYHAIEQLDATQIAINGIMSGRAGIIDAVILSFSTQTTVGYGTVAPAAAVATILAGIQAIFGVFYIAIAIGSVLSFLNNS